MTIAPRAVIRVTGIALAIAVGVMFSSARASAGCGDYVHIADQSAAPSAEAIPFPADHDRGDLHHLPCHGPGCSNRPTQPVPPLTAPVTESGGAKEPAARSDVSDDRADASSRLHIPRAIGSPVRLPIPIFDPPRGV